MPGLFGCAGIVAAWGMGLGAAKDLLPVLQETANRTNTGVQLVQQRAAAVIEQSNIELDRFLFVARARVAEWCGRTNVTLASR